MVGHIDSNIFQAISNEFDLLSTLRYSPAQSLSQKNIQFSSCPVSGSIFNPKVFVSVRNYNTRHVSKKAPIVDPSLHLESFPTELLISRQERLVTFNGLPTKIGESIPTSKVTALQLNT